MKKFKTLAALLLTAALVLALAACGSLTKSNRTLISYDGAYEVSRDMLDYYADYLRGSNPTVDFTEAEMAKTALTYIEDMTMSNYINLCWARDAYGITVEDEDVKSAVEATIQSSIDSAGGEEQFQELLTKNSLTEELYRRLLLEGEVATRLSNKLFASGSDFAAVSDEQIAAFIKNTPVYGAKHILVLANGDFDSALIKANEIAARLTAGESFDTLMKEFSEDPGLASYPNGYAYTAGTMVTEFEEAVKELAVGDISQPVKTTYGYHIIMRVAVDDTFKKDVTEMILQSRVEQKNEEYKQKIKTEYAGGYDSLTFADFKWAY